MQSFFAATGVAFFIFWVCCVFTGRLIRDILLLTGVRSPKGRGGNSSRFSIEIFLFFIFTGMGVHPVFTYAQTPAHLGEIEVQSFFEPQATEKPSAFVSTLYPSETESAVKTLPEILGRLPGVDIQQFSGLGQYSTVTIRGSTAEQVSVFLDGVRLNTAQGGAVDFSSIPLDMIDRVEVIRGGASAEFGSDAVGGVIQIFTKKGGGKLFQASVGAGSFKTLKTHLGFSKTSSDISVLVDHTHLQSSGDFTFKTTPTKIGGAQIGGGETLTRDNNSFFSENFLFRLENRSAKNVRWNLTSDVFGSKREVPPTENEVVLLAPANLPEARESLFKHTLTLKVEWKPAARSKAQNEVLSPFVGEGRGEENFLNSGITRPPALSPQARGDHPYGSSSPWRFTLQPSWHYEQSRFQDPSPALGSAINARYVNALASVKLGAEWNSQTQKKSQHLRLFYEWGLNRFSSESVSPSNSSLSVSSHHRLLHSFFGSHEIHFWSDKVALYPSLRLEKANDFDTRAAFSLGARLHPVRFFALKANVGNAFRYPNFSELYFPDQGIIRGNPNLHPESSFNFDVGPTLYSDWGRLEVSYFKNWIDNSILFVPISAFTIAPVNTQRVHAQGFEAVGLLSPWSHLDLEGNYTFLESRFTDSHAQLPGRPRHQINGKITLKNSWGSVYTRLRWEDRSPLDFQNTAFISSHFQMDAGGEFKFLKRYSVAMEAKNLTNAQTFDARGFPLPRLSVMGSVGMKI